MVVTKTKRKAMEKEQLEYVLQEVMDEDKDSNFTKALTYNKCKGFTDLMGYSSERVEALSFKDTKGKVIKFRSFEISLLDLFLKYCVKCINEGNPLRTTEDVKMLNYEDFCEFQIMYNIPSLTPDISTSSNPSI